MIRSIRDKSQLNVSYCSSQEQQHCSPGSSVGDKIATLQASGSIAGLREPELLRVKKPMRKTGALAPVTAAKI